MIPGLKVRGVPNDKNNNSFLYLRKVIIITVLLTFISDVSAQETGLSGSGTVSLGSSCI